MNSLLNINIFLIGPAGAGKSTVGREIAKALQMDFYDTDHVIEKKTGVEIAWIFDREGERGFRDREAEVLKNLAALSNVVIATGGGTILREENREVMAKSGKILYLKTGLEQQFERASRNQQTRPLLRGGNIKDKLLAMAAERAPLYELIAEAEFETDKKTVASVTRQVIEYLKAQGY